MCVVSMVGDQFNDHWKDWNKRIPEFIPHGPKITGEPVALSGYVTKAEFDKLRAEVELMRDLLIRALEYDRKNNEPNCQNDEKIAKLKKIAELVGIDLDEVFIATK